MLDLHAIAGGLDALAAEFERTHLRDQDRRAAALGFARSPLPLERIRQAVLELGAEMALPRADQTSLATVHQALPPRPYAVLSVDGSQIPPDYHCGVPWYLLNAGSVVLRYPPASGQPAFEIQSHPALRPESRPAGNGEAPEPDDLPPSIDLERTEYELARGTALLAAEPEVTPAVLLLDGPLVQWRLWAGASAGHRDRLRRAYRGLLQASVEKGIPVAGFISRSRAVEWITLLRFALCPDVDADGRLCADCKATLLDRGQGRPAWETDHHYAFAGLRDADLAADLLTDLSAGARTDILELHSRVWDEIAGGAGTLGFFYLRTGTEISRVELPGWVWEHPDRLALVQSAIHEQCRLGGGYPMALAEAHEAAVCRSVDRQAFFALIERTLIARGVTVRASSKAESKRRPAA